MTLEFHTDASLPPLSWCARARAGTPITVRLGTHVETKPEGFVEGAWDGDFDEFGFDVAQTLAGTGGRLRAGRMVFTTPFHPLERLFVLRARDDLFVSNSLVFLLAEAGDDLDLSYPNYFFDLVTMVRNGVGADPTVLRTASGRGVTLFSCCNVEIGADLSLHRTPKPLAAPPSCYTDYFRLLSSTTQTVATNASARGRKTPYRLVTACSRGYDSTASSVLASLAGCREGVTFSRSARITGHPILSSTATATDDSGAGTLRALGMEVTEYDRSELAGLPGHPRAEFYVSPASSTDAATRLMEGTLRGSLFISGRHGERYWGPTLRCKRQDLREVDDCHLSGHALGEFRLRAGFLHFPIPYVGALHGPAIFRITHSPDMRPWKLGTGYYDRPIPRRIAEEAGGLARESFGRHKLGAGHAFKKPNAESEADFRAFLESEVAESIRRRLDPRPPAERLTWHRRLAYLRAHYAHLPVVGLAMDLLGSDRLHQLWNSPDLYRFHWGFRKLAGRYARMPR